jgi:C1A family cysteine protease
VRSISNASNLPIEVDWRALGKVSSIKNQGVCGACWVFAATAIYESILMLGGMS